MTCFGVNCCSINCAVLFMSSQAGEMHCLQKDCIALAGRLQFSEQFSISQDREERFQLIISNSVGLSGVKCIKTLSFK